MAPSVSAINQHGRRRGQEVCFGRQDKEEEVSSSIIETKRHVGPLFALLMDQNNGALPGLQRKSILTWLLCLISQAGKGTKTNTRTIKTYEMEPRGAWALVLFKNKAWQSNRKSHYRRRALSAICRLIYGERLPRGFLQIHARAAAGHLGRLKRPRPE